VLSVKELHQFAASVGADELEFELGPFVLVQRPSTGQFKAG
jgi:hypothetical protein